MATTWKNPAKVATTKDLGSPPVIPGDGKIDEVTLTAGDRILVKDQDDPRENGIYEVHAGPPLALARPVGETVKAGDALLVSERHTNSERWSLGAGGPIMVGATRLPWGRREPFFNVLDFGADPTGTADSWQSFKDWSTAISNAGGGIGLVPSGTYKIDKVADAGATEDFEFEGCNGLWLVGYGAKLNLKGDVHLFLLPDGASDKHMVSPFMIKGCANVCLEGFEVNGNADQLTQEAGVAEPGGHCVTVVNSTHVTIRHMRLHHGWTDGISIRAAFTGTRLACRNVVIENCEVYANVRCNIAVHETRHVHISDCRIYKSGMGIDIEPDLKIGTEFDPDIQPPGSSRFTIIENCEIYNNEKALSVGMRYSQVRVQGCFIDNEQENVRPVILSVPHCALLDSEINTRTGFIDVAINDSWPGHNVFTMERCLIRSNTAIVDGELRTGAGLFIAPDPTAELPRIKQALVANNRFIHESDIPWFPIKDGVPEDNGSRFPNLSHGGSMLQLISRDNYVFIPKAAYHGEGRPMPAVGMSVHLAENNVYDTDLDGDVGFLEVLYGSGTPPKFGVLVRNERFLSAGDGTGFRPGDNSDHNNLYPFSQGVNSAGTELNLGEPAGSQRVFFAPNKPTSGLFRQGDLVFNSTAFPGQPMGWICTKAGDLGAAGVLSDMPSVP